MKKYSRIFKYLSPLKGKITLYIFFTILSVAFSIVSLGMLVPFLDLLFNPDKKVYQLPSGGFSAATLLQTLSYYITKIIDTHSRLYALGGICVVIIISIFLKNLFLYLTYYILGPVRNEIVTRLRNEMYNKILSLPIGFFTEKRKGDLISRMTNDINEIEYSVIGTMEGLIKDPINILFILFSLVFLSQQLSLFLLIFLPLTGFIIGRISRSLKKQSNAAAIKYGESMSILEETLSGLRVIKAFNAESLLQNRFHNTNDELFHVKNKMIYRRDLASPLSEFLGVLVLCGWYLHERRVVLPLVPPGLLTGRAVGDRDTGHLQRRRPGQRVVGSSVRLPGVARGWDVLARFHRRLDDAGDGLPIRQRRKQPCL